MSVITFKCADEDNSVEVVTHDATMCSDIILPFINFMRGCGYFDANIYGVMRELVKEYDGMNGKKDE